MLCGVKNKKTYKNTNIICIGFIRSPKNSNKLCPNKPTTSTYFWIKM